MEFSLEINGVVQDLNGDETLTLTRQLKDVQNLSLATTDFSQEFNLPASRNSNATFEQYFQEGVKLSTWNPFLKLPAKILVESLPIFEGCIELTGVTYEKGIPTFYNIIFYGNVRNSLTEFDQKSLIDMDWSAYDHTVSYANVKLSWSQSLLSGDILYPVVDWYKGFVYSQDPLENNITDAASGIEINDLRPMIKA